MCAGGLQQGVDRTGEGTRVAKAVQVRQNRQCFHYRREPAHTVFRRTAEGVQAARLEAESQQQIIGNGE
jgi:hypothetical protein